MNAVILINKDKGKTSRDVVNSLTKVFNTKRIGHTGTLDPIAQGVLVICINKYTKLVNSFAKDGNLSEKLAKTAVLNNYDYIIQINKLENGKRLVTSIVELTPARTAALSVRTVSKLVNGKYVNDFPQPLTSILADSLIAQSGSMSSRFYNQN